MNIYVVVFSMITVLLSGCSIVDKKNIETSPDNFIIEQNTTDVVTELNELLNYDHSVIFKRNQFEMTEIEKARLLNWLQTIRPLMVGIRGTGGAERHRELGFTRAAEIIDFIQSEKVGVDLVLLDYDASLLGGQGLVTTIPVELAEKIKAQAPILVISSN